MRISFLRTGGVAGMRLSATFEPGSLPTVAEREIEQLLEQAGFFDLRPKRRPPVPDAFTYEVTVEHGGRRHTVRVGEGAAPESLLPLLDRLTEEARRLRASAGAPGGG
jgi:hypothetical protein